MALNLSGRKLLPTRNGNLKTFVEEYLRDNEELTFINMEEMTTTIQNRSYRFQRMRRGDFARMLERAYFEYCNENNIDSSRNRPRPGPSNSQDSDSDVEIQDPPPKATMNNQLKGLYQQNRPTVGPPLEGRNANAVPVPVGIGRGRFTHQEMETNRKMLTPKPVPPSPSRVINLDGDSPGLPGSEQPILCHRERRGSGGSESMLRDEQVVDDDEDDLQIIVEFSTHDSQLRAASTRPILNTSTNTNASSVPPNAANTAPSGPPNAANTPSSGPPNAANTAPSGPPNAANTPSSGPPNAANTPSSGPTNAANTASSGSSNAATTRQSRDQTPTTPAKNKSTEEAKVAQTPSKPAKQPPTVKTVAAIKTEGVDTTTPAPRATKRKLEDDEVSTSSKGRPKSFEDSLGKSRKREIQIQNSNYTFSDFGGSEKLLEEICKLLMHLKHPEMYRTLGVVPPRGFLLHGPPGVGKTLLAQAIAGELKLPILKMAATELISGISGESESNIRDVFEQALSVAPCIIFMDEIDAITPKRENAGREMERRIVAQLLSCIDDLVSKPGGDQVLLIGATSRIEAIDTSLRRAGRFDREICLGIPNESAREKILRVISKALKLEANFDFRMLAKLTPGYVGADLQALVREAAVQAVTQILNAKAVKDSAPPTPLSSDVKMDVSGPDVKMDVSGPDVDVITIDELELGEVPPEVGSASEVSTSSLQLHANTAVAVPTPWQQPVVSSTQWITATAPLTEEELANFCITFHDFVKAHKYVQPSAKREGFATVPDTTWADIGALQDIRDELQVSILGPVKYSSAFEALGLNAPAGVLLCGPPGCGKTLLAKAVANEAGINFISVKGPELLNMYVGESERAVRQCFQRAKNSAPCVIFFDELDSLCPRRSDGIESGSSSRVVNQLLTEMDGMESRLGVFVMGATNRPDIIDPAILRPGRLDKVLFVNLPSPSERVDILKAVTKNGTMPKFAEDVKIEEIGLSEKCENYTGADLASLVREAGIAAFRDLILGNNAGAVDTQNEDLKIHLRHFEQAFSRTKPSVSQKDRAKYEKMKEMHSILATQ